MFLTRIIYGIQFFIVLVVEIIKAVIDTAACSLKGDVDPVVVKIKPDLKRPVSLAILCNTITLTPGTITVDMDQEEGVLTVSAITPRATEDIIPLEPYIKKMLE
ncbi:MAG: Na+/H+ antiporter subunit E [Methanosphaera sp.]|uniref:Na+/H+ antiporter subunit E n=1 Tax=Methanosphaera sp. TaxID=2666342 RepID=UPI0025EE47C4|nr:Na+/H+ antiporter subunit E [Methanosphaera sp.]MCI5866868.1 Na+/H+ antiporter subunit E [Methanosphaera sp.]MDD6534375.1 Na+/H+ antiporter subunit E [Methanosphaera sp.]MDY3955220.1 Na+/H+ antiporter subunit E [Methanosphaera sp.]